MAVCSHCTRPLSLLMLHLTAAASQKGKRRIKPEASQLDSMFMEEWLINRS